MRESSDDQVSCGKCGIASGMASSVKSREEQDDEQPPMSRLFIICNKTNTEEEFRESFSKFGAIEEIWIVKDKLSGEHKGRVGRASETAVLHSLSLAAHTHSHASTARPSVRPPFLPGVAYVKFSKTSEAAKALEEMNGKLIGQSQRPIKVLVASR